MILPNAPSSHEPEPTWEIARLFPSRGEWGEGDFLQLNRQTNRLVELSDGDVEVLEMPTRSHQRMLMHLQKAIESVVEQGQLGEVLIAPYPVRLWKGTFREPDILFVLKAHADRVTEDYADGSDLVFEITNTDRQRDLETKREEYARAGIPEYWIVDRREQKIMVLTLADGRYILHIEAAGNVSATSLLLPTLAVRAAALFAAAETAGS